MSNPGKSSSVRLVTVDQDRHGQRIDNFLTAHLKGVPRTAIYKMIRTGQVRINGKRCKPATKLSAGDEVRVPPARVREDGQVVLSARVCEQVRESILYRDDELLVVDKPSGMAVHSGSGLPWGLIDVVRQLFPDQYVELAHRLDRETSGILLLARSGAALGHLNGLFRDDRVEKRYLCLLNGPLGQDFVEVDAPLRKVHDGGESRMVVEEGGKPATTRFRLLQAFRDCCYVEAEILSGRTHQIRVHAQSIGNPLAADARYSDSDSVEKWTARGLKRLFLHAHRVRLARSDGEVLDLTSPLPADLRSVLDSLDGTSPG